MTALDFGAATLIVFGIGVGALGITLSKQPPDRIPDFRLLDFGLMSLMALVIGIAALACDRPSVERPIECTQRCWERTIPTLSKEGPPTDSALRFGYAACRELCEWQLTPSPAQAPAPPAPRPQAVQPQSQSQPQESKP